MKTLTFSILFICTCSLIAQTFSYTDKNFEKGDKMIFPDLNYSFCGDDEERNKLILDSLGMFLKTHRSLIIKIGSHTDQRGSENYNLRLSTHKAKSIKEHLVKYGIDSLRILAEGYGESKPIIFTDSIQKLKTEEEMEESYRQNRRTEIEIVKN